MPLFRRYGRPGLLGAIDGRAVLGGTPQLIARSIASPADSARPDHEVSSDSPSPLTSALSPPLADQLRSLISIHTSGDISDDEFVRAKARLLE